MNTEMYNIPTISCEHCVHTIQIEIAELEGVQSVQVDLNSKSASVTFDAPATDEIIRRLLAEINYPAVD